MNKPTDDAKKKLEDTLSRFLGDGPTRADAEQQDAEQQDKETDEHKKGQNK